MEIIIYELNGATCTLAQGFNNGLTLLETGQRDVPTGVPFWVIDPTELPTDEPTESWEIDATALGEPTGIGGSYVEKEEEYGE